VSLGLAASSEMVDDVLKAYAAAAGELIARFEEVCLPSSTLPHRQRGSRTSGRAKPKDGDREAAATDEEILGQPPLWGAQGDHQLRARQTALRRAELEDRAVRRRSQSYPLGNIALEC
jgi:hypothetical protein